jgi:hypothetical protein
VKEEALPFAQFAEEWHRREIALPLERGHEGHVAPGSAEIYALQIRVHLIPYFKDRDVRTIGRGEVQGFYDHCVETGRPRSAKSIEMALSALRQILSYARTKGIVTTNGVEEWKRDRRKRRRSASMHIEAVRVMSAEDLGQLLGVAYTRRPRYFPLFLFLADRVAVSARLLHFAGLT